MLHIEKFKFYIYYLTQKWICRDQMYTVEGITQLLVRYSKYILLKNYRNPSLTINSCDYKY